MSTEEDAPRLWRHIEDRLATLHPKKTKIDYLLLTSQVTGSSLGWRSGVEIGSSHPTFPDASSIELKAFRRRVRKWGQRILSEKGLIDLARMFNRQFEAQIGYFKCFYKSALYPTLRLIDAHFVRWVMLKYKRFKRRPW